MVVFFESFILCLLSFGVLVVVFFGFLFCFGLSLFLHKIIILY
ncbi:hypothetical Protein pso3_07810 [Candidatus Phytoplasma solani]